MNVCLGAFILINVEGKKLTMAARAFEQSLKGCQIFLVLLDPNSHVLCDGDYSPVTFGAFCRNALHTVICSTNLNKVHEVAYRKTTITPALLWSAHIDTAQ